MARNPKARIVILSEAQNLCISRCGRGSGETRRVSPALLKMADGKLGFPSVLFSVSSDSYMAKGMISCRNCLQFLAGYGLGEGRLQCGEDDAGGLLDDFERFGQQ
jgi:hypothetical protein